MVSDKRVERFVKKFRASIGEGLEDSEGLAPNTVRYRLLSPEYNSRI
ncbi:MAG: hypothetical protein J7J28_04045 [Thaumarchaeota archaeon]|nr:hypothetical protein [Nitrososphaerota archaeon]